MPGASFLTTTNGSTLSPLQGITINAADLPKCLDIVGDSATYVVAAQFATGSGPSSSTSFEVGASASGGVANVVGMPAGFAAQVAAIGRRPEKLQQRFDRRLRGLEHHLARRSPAALETWRANRVRGDVAAATLPSVGSTRTFQVLADTSGTVFVTDTATLRYVGTNIMVYVDQNAPPEGEGGFSDAQFAAFGKMFDQELYTIDVQTFGAPSDIDQNGHVIVLFTPTVNKITPSSECSTGYVAGFFYGNDLLPTQAHSNAGEIFYSLVPDPNGDFSCRHNQGDVDQITPATFIHEFQHMISWNQHVIVRNGSDEALWLNEGMSHIAEEMGSRYYENKYPPPTGRSSAGQVFPDSAEGFIIGDLINSYDYMLDPTKWSITQFIQGGRLEERGGAWLFLRWLGDQMDSTIYAKLEQTNLTGIANVEAQTKESFPALFGNFSMALYTDSLPGVAREAIPSRYRFTSRNLRYLYRVLNFNDPQDFPEAFPLQLKLIGAPGSNSSSMVPGTTDFFRLQLPNDGAAETLHFSQPGGAPLDDSLNAQVTVFRCPSAAECQ
jgi:hypothetical protein